MVAMILHQWVDEKFLGGNTPVNVTIHLPQAQLNGQLFFDPSDVANSISLQTARCCIQKKFSCIQILKHLSS